MLLIIRTARPCLIRNFPKINTYEWTSATHLKHFKNSVNITVNIPHSKAMKNS